jgi:GNAT superfamily N-acetyltransferase
MSEILVSDVKHNWQRAGVHYVRAEGMSKGFNIPIDIEFEDDTPESAYFLATDDGFPVGTCRYKLLDSETGKIERVCVLEEYRGKEVGRLLIEAAERELKLRGAKRVVIYSRDAVTGFYERLGYTADWEHTHQGFFPEIYTEKTL